MSVIIRERKIKGGVRLHLETNFNGKRNLKSLKIDILDKDSAAQKKDKRDLANHLRLEQEMLYLSGEHKVPIPALQSRNFLDFYQTILNSYDKKDVRKHAGAKKKFEEFLVGLPLMDQSVYKIKNTKDTPLKIPFSSIDINLCESFAEFLFDPKRGKISGETPSGYWKAFKSVINFACRRNLMLHNPTTAIRLKGQSGKGNKLKKEILTIEELIKLNQTDLTNREVKRAFLFACFTGLGESEIKRLTWGHIIDNNLKIERSKTSEFIDLELHKDAVLLLGEKGNKKDRVFDLPSNTAVKKHLANWMKNAKIDKHITFYCARHTFAVNLLLVGTDVKTVANCLGHSSLKYVERYLNHINPLRGTAIRKMPGIF